MTAALLPWLCLVAPVYVLRDGPVDQSITYLSAVGQGQVVGIVLVLGPLVGAVGVALAAARGVTGPWWALACVVVAACSTGVTALLGQGAVIWSGTDEHGRDIGGLAVPEPS